MLAFGYKWGREEISGLGIKEGKRFEILLGQQRAAQQLQLATVVSVPHIKEADRKKFFRSLQYIIDPNLEAQKAEAGWDMLRKRKRK